MFLHPTYGPKWIEMLRSGEYKQRRGVLCENGGRGYCCMGVAALAMGYQFDETNPQQESFDGYTVYANPLTGPGIHPKESPTLLELDEAILDKMGLSIEEQSTLVDMNDKHGNSFDEIADWLERENSHE